MKLSLGFGSQSHLVIDPGRHTLKIGIGTLGAKGRWAKLQAVYTVATGATPQTTPDQVIERHGELIQEVLKRHNLSARQVSFAIPGRASFVRQLKIPRVSGDRLRRLIQYEARQQIPFPIEDIILDSHVFDADEPELGITLVAIRKAIIDQYCTMLQSAGLVPDNIDVTTLSLFDAFYPQLKDDPHEVIALVDIGASTTDIIVCKHGRVEFIRTAPQAGDLLTKVLSDQLGVGWEEAESLKISAGELDSTIDRQTDPLAYGEKNQAARIRVFLSKAFDAISNEIRRTLDFYVSQPDGEPIGKIYLTGGTAKCPGIARFVENRLGTTCEVRSPFEETLVDIESLHSAPLETLAPVLLGLCQRNIGDVPLRMNFLPQSIVKQKEFEKRRTVLAAEGILLAFLIGFSVVTMGQSIDVFKQASDSLEAVVDRKSDTAKKIGTYMDNTRKVEERVDYLREIGRNRGVITMTMAEVAEKLPLGETWLKSIDIDTIEIRMDMRGSDAESVVPLKDQMKEVTRLREINVGKMEKLPSEGVRFSVTAKVEKSPSQELSRLRQKLESRAVKLLDASLEMHGSPPQQTAAAKVVVSEAFNDAERSAVVQDILHAVADAQLGFSRTSVSIVFHNAQRQPTGTYDIEQEEMDELLQGKREVKDLTLKPPTQ